MKSKQISDESRPEGRTGSTGERSSEPAIPTNLGDSIDSLVEYLVDNDVEGIHPFIMGEVEKRLIIKALERSRGNKLKAARMLGMNRNTFNRKIRKLDMGGPDGGGHGPEA